MKKYFIISPFVLFLSMALSQPVLAATLGQKLAGKIMLQVESHGGAWYINPANLERYYLGRPADAFQIMKTLGLGITNQNLLKIPADLTLYQGTDTDNDGLPDEIEKSIGTDLQNKDTDNDGFSDGEEVKNGFSPLGSGTLPWNNNFAEAQKGKILLQVESFGQAWYVNPANSTRYFLGRPADAFLIMKKLGLGISNADLSQIKIASDSLQPLNDDINISQPPQQTPLTNSAPIIIQNGNITTTLEPLYKYEISGKVEDVVEVKDEAHDIMPVDVVTSWGILATYTDMVTSQHEGRIAHNTFRYYEGQKLCETGNDGECIANNHLIPANDNLRQAILAKIKKGDRIEMTGYLVNGEKVTKTENKIQTVKFTTSTVRSDEGINSCEIIYLTGLQIGSESYQ
ncbi:MAG: thrombospondin type 3 repeat-containing protein [bacterium]